MHGEGVVVQAEDSAESLVRNGAGMGCVFFFCMFVSVNVFVCVCILL